MAGVLLAAGAAFAGTVLAAGRGAGPAIPTGQSEHLAGFGPHDAGPGPYGAHSREPGPGAGAPPPKLLALEDVARQSPPPVHAGRFPSLGKEIAHFRTQYSRTYESPDGGYVARTFESPVNFRAPDGSWQPIDDSLKAASDGFTNRADSYRAFLPAKLGGSPVQVKAAAGSMTMTLLGPHGRAARGRAVVSGDRATYADVLPGVTLSYTTLAGKVKEALSLASPAAARRSFTFSLSFAGGLHPRLARGGAVQVLGRSGKVRFLVLAPTMQDSATPMLSRGHSPPAPGPVRVSLSRRGRGWSLVLRPDRRWLAAAGRRWPVTIDPTLSQPSYGVCTIAGGADANTNYCPAGSQMTATARTRLRTPLTAPPPLPMRSPSSPTPAATRRPTAPTPPTACTWPSTPRATSARSTYTPDDNVQQFTAPSGAAFATSYDGQDRPTGGSLPASKAGQTAASFGLSYSQQPGCTAPCHPYEPDGSTDPQGHQLSYGYDQSNNLQSVTNQLGSQNTLKLNHNANGTLGSSTDADGHQTTYGYDAQGNPTSVTDPTGSCGSPRQLCTTLGVDPLSRPTSVTDGKGQNQGITYDAMDRVSKQSFADGSSVAYSYDPDGNLTQQVDSAGGTTTYAYDAKGRITS